MVGKKNFNRLRPTVEDLLRTLGYLTLTLWTVTFLIFPPLAYLDQLDFFTRLAWLGITGLGAFVAALGSVFRFDLKVELPGLVFALIGPVFYFAAQLYFNVHPSTLTLIVGTKPLVVYSVLPAILLLPRIWALYIESRRQKRISASRIER